MATAELGVGFIEKYRRMVFDNITGNNYFLDDNYRVKGRWSNMRAPASAGAITALLQMNIKFTITASGGDIVGSKEGIINTLIDDLKVKEVKGDTLYDLGSGESLNIVAGFIGANDTSAFESVLDTETQTVNAEVILPIMTTRELSISMETSANTIIEEYSGAGTAVLAGGTISFQTIYANPAAATQRFSFMDYEFSGAKGNNHLRIDKHIGSIFLSAVRIPAGSAVIDDILIKWNNEAEVDSDASMLRRTLRGVPNGDTGDDFNYYALVHKPIPDTAYNGKVEYTVASDEVRYIMGYDMGPMVGLAAPEPAPYVPPTDANPMTGTAISSQKEAAAAGLTGGAAPGSQTPLMDIWRQFIAGGMSSAEAYQAALAQIQNMAPQQQMQTQQAAINQQQFQASSTQTRRQARRNNIRFRQG